MEVTASRQGITMANPTTSGRAVPIGDTSVLRHGDMTLAALSGTAASVPAEDRGHPPAVPYSVQSEVGQLRRVIVHRPGMELDRLTPGNIESLLFDDVLWAQRAREEHDAFVQVLWDKGVEVHYYGDLLAETLQLPEGRAFVLDRVCTPEMLGPSLVDPVRTFFETLDGRALAGHLIGGVLRDDLPLTHPHSLRWDLLEHDAFVLPPLPKHLFQRDNSCWMCDGVTINPMAEPACQRESLHTRANPRDAS